MNNRLSNVEEMIRKKNRRILIVSGFLITIISFISFFVRYYEKREELIWTICDSFREYSMKLDPNEVLSHTGFGVIIYALICVSVIYLNHHYLNRHSKSAYLLKRVPRRGYYYQCIAKYPLKLLFVMFIVTALLEWFYISYTMNNDISLINPLYEIDYLRLIV